MVNTGILYIVTTPIGNLSDITLRALDTLKAVDLVLCEDTRVTKKLLDHYKIKKPTLSYHKHSKVSKSDKVVKFLREGKSLALVSDAGTPGISDPGNELISYLQTKLENVKIIPIPGPSSITTLLSVSGIDVSKFLFLGFLPHKKGRKTLTEKIKESKYPVIVFESKYRLLKFINEFKRSDKYIIIGRELTKIFEEVVRGEVDEICEYFENNPGKLKGEFVLILSSRTQK